MSKIEGLQQFLRDNIVIEEVGFDELGQWYFTKTVQATKTFTRDEVLSPGFEKKLNKTSDQAENVETTKTISKNNS